MNALIPLTMVWMASKPNSSAATMSSSEISLISPSTIEIASALPATIRSMSLAARSSPVGKRMNSPSARPTRTWAVGPANGEPLSDSAAEEPMPAMTSASISMSAART